MSQLRSIPELLALRSASGLVRIPPGVDVPLTPRVRQLLDTPAMRRLAAVRQLGLVSLVYPGAMHSRFEHSLGVFRMALVYLERLIDDERFASICDVRLAERLLVAALVHDIGHWPYCHPIEDMQLPEVIEHEDLAREALASRDVATALAAWNTTPDEVADLVAGRTKTDAERLAASILSSPIDVDKVDYLERDSLHAGVPYGSNFDSRRLVSSLCLNDAGNGLALTDKGRTAAELLVFARYVMFSEVYWHHAVRSATAMLQRAVWESRDCLPWRDLYTSTDETLPALIDSSASASATTKLTQGLWGGRRQLYKRLAQYSYFESEDVYRLLARQPYERLVACAERLARLLGGALHTAIEPYEVLIDAPPRALEVQFKLDVRLTKSGLYRPLGDVSPVVRSLAREQFDDYVKRVRVYVAPRVAELARPAAFDIDALVAASAS